MECQVLALMRVGKKMTIHPTPESCDLADVGYTSNSLAFLCLQIVHAIKSPQPSKQVQ